MKIKLLYFQSCPGWQQTKKNLEEVIAEQSLDIDFNTLEITEHLIKLPDGFYGSPTLQYWQESAQEWKELFGETGESVMACRTYTHHGKITPYIPKEMLQERLQEVTR